MFPFSLGEHPFGQNTVGKDYFAMVMRGIVNSSYIMFIIGIIGAFIGVVVGAIAGYYRGWVDAVLMRITDIVIVIPIIVDRRGRRFRGRAAWAAWRSRSSSASSRGRRSRDSCEPSSCRCASASSSRRPASPERRMRASSSSTSCRTRSASSSSTTTLLIAAAIILETSLSFLGYGVQAPDVSLGLLISGNESAFQTRPWLFWWPAVFIVVLSLLVNFVGDGLRDAFDPRQKRRSRKVKDCRTMRSSSGTTADVPEGPTPPVPRPRRRLERRAAGARATPRSSR